MPSDGYGAALDQDGAFPIGEWVKVLATSDSVSSRGILQDTDLDEERMREVHDSARGMQLVTGGIDVKEPYDLICVGDEEFLILPRSQWHECATLSKLEEEHTKP